MKRFIAFLLFFLMSSGICYAVPFTITSGTYTNSLTGENFEITGTVDFIDHADYLELFYGCGLGIISVDGFVPIDFYNYPGTSFPQCDIEGLGLDHYDFYGYAEGADVTVGISNGVANIVADSIDPPWSLYGVDVQDISFTLGITHHFSQSGGTQFHESFTINATAPVPEPASVFLMGTGLAGLVGFRRKYKK